MACPTFAALENSYKRHRCWPQKSLSSDSLGQIASPFEAAYGEISTSIWRTGALTISICYLDFLSFDHFAQGYDGPAFIIILMYS